MQHFFVAPKQVGEEYILIEGTDVNHVKNVLRMHPGEKLRVSDGDNQSYLGEIQELGETQIVVRILEKEQADTELLSKLYLFQGLPKGDKMELIVQKAVELGAYEIIPVETRRAVVKPDAKKAVKKVERWNAISESAAKQAGRSRIPQVTAVMTYQEALSYAQQVDVILLPYELEEGMAKTKEVIGQISDGQSVGIFIGPEGGFEKEEVAQALSKGAKVITLGKRILRTETAGITTLSILMYHLES
ncbi:MAG: 16S rRNA (uracil(1498)-N(3))-methyltransferase [Lachnospiraceae bacterium]